jgi:hypothetical protein
MEGTKFETVGGHAENIGHSEGKTDVLLKKTSQSEFDFYNACLTDKTLKQFSSQFMPKYFGEGQPVNAETADADGQRYIQIENLLDGLNPDTTSICDIKLGTSTMTKRCVAIGGEKV